MDGYIWGCILLIIGAVLFSFDKKVRFHLQLKIIIPALIIVDSIFLGVIIYLDSLSVISFINKGLSGITFLLIPIEFCCRLLSISLFFFVIYLVFKAYFSKYRPVQFAYVFSFIFSLGSVILAIIYHEKDYTFWVLLSAGLFNWIIYFGYTPRWYPYFLNAFLFIWVPILVVYPIFSALFSEGTLLQIQSDEVWSIPSLNFTLENLWVYFLWFFLGVLLYEYFTSSLKKRSS